MDYNLFHNQYQDLTDMRPFIRLLTLLLAALILTACGDGGSLAETVKQAKAGVSEVLAGQCNQAVAEHHILPAVTAAPICACAAEKMTGQISPRDVAEIMAGKQTADLAQKFTAAAASCAQETLLRPASAASDNVQ